MLSTGLFIVLASLLSTFLAYAWILLFLGLYPFWLLSFPFVSSLDVAPSYAIIAYDINLCTLKIAAIPLEYGSLFGFLFFFSVNLLGATLGYSINRRFPEQSLELKIFDCFFRSCILSFIACFFIFWLMHILRPPAPIATNLIFFCIYYFWIPAVIATATYGIYERREHEIQKIWNSYV